MLSRAHVPDLSALEGAWPSLLAVEWLCSVSVAPAAAASIIKANLIRPQIFFRRV